MGMAAVPLVKGGEPTLDSLVVNTLGGDDSVKASASVGAFIRAVVDGGADTDTVFTDGTGSADTFAVTANGAFARIDDLGATIRQFKAHLARVRSLREMREDGRRIAEAQEERGVDAPVPEAYRSLYERGRQVHAIARGVPPALEHGTPGPRRSPDE